MHRNIRAGPYSCYSKPTLRPESYFESFTIRSKEPFLGIFPADPYSLGSCHVPCAPIDVTHQYTVIHVVRVSLFPISHDPTILPSISHPLMSHTHPISPSSNFQLIFDNALESYKKRTKKDLLTHPLAAQLQDCRSPSSILDVLQQQVQELNQSRQRSERWTRWLDPTVKVLHAFSETLGDVTSVCLSSSACLRSAL